MCKRMKIMLFIAALAAAGLGYMQLAAAQTDHSAHAAPEAQAESPATSGYKAAMEKMHGDMMALAYSGDADIDFVRGMIPHHQAAIDMARVLLEHGRDPEMRKLAEAVIAAQEKEIKEMENWLAAHPAKN